MLERADQPHFWQSVTGSRECLNEALLATAQREVLEETGIKAGLADLHDWQRQNQYLIYPHWRHRYAPDVTHNLESVFGLCVPADTPVCLAPREHTRFQWLAWPQAADLAFSCSNAAAIRWLPHFLESL